ncbi:hypothetical protein FZW96_21230 [Bacillus sp. BGMRC 2118]|nr:hypothetical protein FZW96_21230 [Bacillus sp. BGMRC 2118]
MFHDDKYGKKEEKYIHPDGREAVFNGDTTNKKKGTGELVTDPRYVGTYNYVNPSKLPEGNFPKRPEEMLDWMVQSRKFVVTNFWHSVLDVAPYYLLGSNNTRDQQRFQNDKKIRNVESGEKDEN